MVHIKHGLSPDLKVSPFKSQALIAPSYYLQSFSFSFLSTSQLSCPSLGGHGQLSPFYYQSPNGSVWQ